MSTRSRMPCTANESTTFLIASKLGRWLWQVSAIQSSCTKMFGIAGSAPIAGRLMNWQPVVAGAVQMARALGLYQTPFVSHASRSPSPSVSADTDHVTLAGVGSALPARSEAATLKV